MINIPNVIYENHTPYMEKLPFIFHNAFTITNNSGILNWHKNIEIIYCLDGCGIAQIDSYKYKFKKGDILFINTNAIHAFTGDKSATYDCLIIDNEFCKENGLDATNVRISSFIQNEEASAILEKISSEILKHRASPSAISLAKIRKEMLTLLIELYENHTEIAEEREHTHYSSKRVKKIIHYIQENIQSKLTLESIAKAASISKYHLCREFKSLTGTTVFNFINAARCKEAKSLIANGASVSEAAYAVGFENLSYFSKKFGQIIGCLPSECARTTKKGHPQSR